MMSALLAALLPCAAAFVDGSEPVADFLLEAANGERVALIDDEPARRLTLLAFTSTSDAAARQWAPRLAELDQKFRGRGVRFLAIDPNAADARAAIAAFAAEFKLQFPILRDPLQVVTERLGARSTAELLLLDAEFKIVCRGGDAIAGAIEAVLNGQPIANAITDAPGVPIVRASGAAPADVTFHRDVAPILWKNCVECHRPGQIGPMSFLDAAEVVGWAPQIAEVTGGGRMPPWHANPRYGHWKNERRLTDTDQRTLALWAASGAKLGDPKDAPPTPTFADPEWRIGRPDLVVELPAEQPIPAEGVVPYRYVLVDPHVAQDTWVQCVEVRPSHLEVTHHVGVFLMPEGARARQPSTELLFGGSSPGGDPIVLPDGYGKLIPKGAKFLFQLHYTPNGKATTDRTRMGLRLARGTITHEVRTHAIANPQLELAPNDPCATFTCSDVFGMNLRVTTLMPHMHLRGKAFRFELTRASGERSVLLDVPTWDFNWQYAFEPSEPIALGPGDRITITATYDNSKDNRLNPDPSKRVKWGEQIFEEMMVGYMSVERELAKPVSLPAGSRR